MSSIEQCAKSLGATIYNTSNTRKEGTTVSFTNIEVSYTEMESIIAQHNGKLQHYWLTLQDNGCTVFFPGVNQKYATRVYMALVAIYVLKSQSKKLQLYITAMKKYKVLYFKIRTTMKGTIMYDFGTIIRRYSGKKVEMKVIRHGSDHPQWRHIHRVRDSAHCAANRNDVTECRRLLKLLKDLRAPGVFEAEQVVAMAA